MLSRICCTTAASLGTSPAAMIAVITTSGGGQSNRGRAGGMSFVEAQLCSNAIEQHLTDTNEDASAAAFQFLAVRHEEVQAHACARMHCSPFNSTRSGATLLRQHRITNPHVAVFAQHRRSVCHSLDATTAGHEEHGFSSFTACKAASNKCITTCNIEGQQTCQRACALGVSCAVPALVDGQ